jgi:integrase
VGAAWLISPRPRSRARRQEQGAANGTINRELATIGPMMQLAYRHRKAARFVFIERLKENASRAGFFEEDQYKAVLRHLSADLQVVAAIAHAFGWRAPSEILTLERRHLDLDAGTLRLGNL